MSDISSAIDVLKQGGVIAYPTEAVYGLGCNPLSEHAVQQVLALKKRSVSKGLILIAANWEQLADYVTPLSEETLTRILPTWPGPVTWVLPASPKTPEWIRGAHDTVAVRVTDHPIAKSLCEAYGAPLVSTSANISGMPPVMTTDEAKEWFPDLYVLGGDVGGLSKPTEMRDGVTGEVIRG